MPRSWLSVVCAVVSSGGWRRTVGRVQTEADLVARAGDRRRVQAAMRRVNAALEELTRIAPVCARPRR